jgi:transcriptional regulator with XRE-family HTH domain
MASHAHLGKSVHSASQTALCELLIAARKKAGLTQQDLARRLSKPQSFIAKYETGERRVDVLEFIVIVRAIGADPLRIIQALLKRVV